MQNINETASYKLDVRTVNKSQLLGFYRFETVGDVRSTSRRVETFRKKMKVKCIIDDLTQLEDTPFNKKMRELSNFKYDNTNLFIKKGEEYIVYGIVWLGDEITKFLLCDEENCDYPTPFVSVFFDIVDNSIPSDWKLRIKYYEDSIYTKISFPEMIDDETFYDKLLDGEEREEAIFKEYKEKYKKLYG